MLIVSNNEDVSVPLWHALERAGIRAEVVPGGPEAVLPIVGGWLSGQGSGSADCAWGAIADATDHSGIELIRRLREAFPELFLLAAVVNPDLKTSQAIAEAGARDFLVHPFDEDQIAACLRLWGECPAAAPSGRMVCFLPARGGDGASTVALHVADSAVHERRERGFGGRVLLADLDLQTGDVAFRLQLSPQRTLADALQIQSADEAAPLWRDCVCPWRQVDVLVSPPPGASLSSGQLRRTAALLSSARARYPFVVCDMPPAIHSSSTAVLQQADEVYIVCTPEITSLHLAQRRVEDLQHAGVERDKLRLVLNRTGSHPWIGSEEAGHSVGLPVSARLANDYAGLHAAILKGVVVARRSTLGRQFTELTRQALGLRARAAAA
jgi:pilus assembly protein CpaE